MNKNPLIYCNIEKVLVGFIRDREVFRIWVSWYSLLGYMVMVLHKVDKSFVAQMIIFLTEISLCFYCNYRNLERTKENDIYLVPGPPVLEPNFNLSRP